MVSAAQQTGAVLDAVGAKGEASATKIVTAGEKVTASMVRQYSTLQEAQRAWAAEARAMSSVSDAQARLERTQTEAAVAQLRAADAVKASTAAASAGAAALTQAGTAAEGASLPLGRLRQSFTSLAAQMTGTSPVIDRILTTLGSFGVGNAAVIGIVAGIAAIGFAWRKLNADASAEAKEATDRIKALRDEMKKAQDATGDMAVAAARAEVKTAQAALDAAQRPTYGAAGAKTGIATDNTSAIAAAKTALDQANTDLFQALQDKTKIDNQMTDEGRRSQDEQLASVIRFGVNAGAAIKQAQAIIAADRIKIPQLLQAGNDPVQVAQLIDEVNTLEGAFKKGAASIAHADDAVTHFKDVLAQLDDEAHAFGKDDAIDTRMRQIAREIDRQITLLKRAKGVDNAPAIAALEADKQQLPAAGDALKANRQTQFNDSLDAQITKMRDANAAQVALDATRSQSVSITNDVMIANAGSLAVEEAQARATQQHTVVAQQYIDTIRQLAEAHEREAIQAKQPDTFVTSAQTLAAQTQENINTRTGDPSAELQHLNAAYIDALDAQHGLVQGSADYKTIQEAINVILRARKGLLDATRTAEQQAAKQAAESWNAVAAALHGVGDVATALGGSILGKLLNPGANIAQGIAAFTQAASAVDSQGNAQPNITGEVTAGFGVVGSGIAIISTLVQAFTQQDQIEIETHAITKANTDAITQNTLKLQGFIAQSADNATKAAAALQAFERSGNAVLRVYNNQTGSFPGGGNLQSQINALTPFLQASGLTYNEFMAIAKSDGATLLDNQGRLSAAALQQFEAGLTAATQAAWTLSQSFSDESGLNILIAKSKGQTTTQDTLDAQWSAFTAAAPNAGEPNVNPNTLAGMNGIRTYVQGILAQEKAAQNAGTPFNYSQYGNFTSEQALNDALNQLLDPLNALTSTVNGVVDSLTNVPSGFKVAYDRFLSTNPGTDTVGPLSVAGPLQRGYRPSVGGTGTPADVSPAPITINGPVTIVSSATNYSDLVKDVGTQFQSAKGRGGTTRLGLVISQGQVAP